MATQVIARNFFRWSSYVTNNDGSVTQGSICLDASAYSQAKRRWEGSTSPYGCGEDSFFIYKKDGKSSCIGVCDGVGGWNAFGVNPAFIARQMCLNAHAFAKEHNKLGLPQNPQVLMAKAYEKIKNNNEVEAGSTTCCILSLDTSGRQPLIRSANLGDSGYIIIRNGEVVAYSDFQRVDLAPMQLAIIPDRFSSIGAIQTDPAQADMKEHAVEEGDIIILASDGLWDNCSVQDMTVLVTDMNQRGAATAEIAQVLVETALSFYVKPDDITVVVAKVKF
eukprot:c18266_g1_i2.p1 GENE.c18266_g1_i2~~c18266_g1_i2.p1  ORF type:complete len:278 (+),score=-10.43 c18266_g1_i2:76-909(+)